MELRWSQAPPSADPASPGCVWGGSARMQTGQVRGKVAGRAHADTRREWDTCLWSWWPVATPGLAVPPQQGCNTKGK